jgi:hypothetical protein
MLVVQYIFCIFNDNLSAECAVQPPSNRVAVIPDDMIANAKLFCERMVANINEKRNIFPVPSGAAKKYIRPVSSYITHIIVL